MRKEAVLSSQIEGTGSTLTDLLLFELEEDPAVLVDDTNQVLADVRAMRRGEELLRVAGPTLTVDNSGSSTRA